LFHAFVDSGGRLEFVAEEVAGWSEAQLIEQALTTGLIADKSDRHVSRDAPGWVSVVFGRAGSQYPQR